MSTPAVATWRKVFAAILDTLVIFFVTGYLIALVTGETTSGGFSLNGMSAVVLLIIVVAYFVVGGRTGGTLFQRILRTRG
jgi:Na+/melibiose symporter-like transporter